MSEQVERLMPNDSCSDCAALNVLKRARDRLYFLGDHNLDLQIDIENAFRCQTKDNKQQLGYPFLDRWFVYNNKLGFITVKLKVGK